MNSIDELFNRKDFQNLVAELLEVSSNQETKVVTLALLHTLLTVIVHAAPTLEEAKHALKGALERIEPGIDAAWAKYRDSKH